MRKALKTVLVVAVLLLATMALMVAPIASAGTPTNGNQGNGPSKSKFYTVDGGGTTVYQKPGNTSAGGASDAGNCANAWWC